MHDLAGCMESILQKYPKPLILLDFSYTLFLARSLQSI